MIVLFTDFGHSGPYVAQMQAVLIQQAPETPVLELISDAPKFNPHASSLLLAAYSRSFPVGTIFLCVVDPGVGSKRLPVVVRSEGKFFVGPDNGLFTEVCRQATNSDAWKIKYRPEKLSHSFHGRDIFAPVAAMIARGDDIPGDEYPIHKLVFTDMEAEFLHHQVIYVDHYGNCITGLKAGALLHSDGFCIDGQRIAYARTFSEVETGSLFWYENSSDLIEIAANCADSATILGLSVGSPLIPC